MSCAWSRIKDVSQKGKTTTQNSGDVGTRPALCRRDAELYGRYGAAGGGIDLPGAVAYVPWSKEQAIASQPQAIFCDADDKAALMRDPVWRQTPAVRHGNVFVTNDAYHAARAAARRRRGRGRDRPRQGAAVTRAPQRSSCAPKAEPSAQIFILMAVLLLSCCYALTLGPAHLSLADVSRALIAPLLHRHTATLADEIVWPIRAPRIVLAAALGASLSAAGTAFQSLLRNDLAEPYTTGVSAGASVAGSATLAFGWDTLLGGRCFPSPPSPARSP